MKGSLLQQIKVTLADSSKDSKYSQHPLPPIKQVALSPVSPFTKMKIALALQTRLLTKPQRHEGSTAVCVKIDSQVFQGFRSEVMTFQKEKTLPFVGYFLLLAKSLENSLYMNTLNQSLRRFLKADTRF